MKKLYKLISKSIVAGLGLALFTQQAQAQAPTISYPTAADSITRAGASSKLTVKLVFNAKCDGIIRLGFAESVRYKASTVNKTGGTAGVSIAESDISNLARPQFSITGVVSPGDEITFTVDRIADCGALASVKDSVYFIAGSGCSDASEIATGVNAYNLLAPALSLTPPVAITNAVLGTTATRSTVVTNGGNGATDTVRFYVVYTNAGIVNTTGTNTITVGSSSFTPWKTSGDTLFYKIFGATLFGGDNMLTTGENISISEPIKVVKCNANTAYGAYWGRSQDSLGCQQATGTSAVTMATGVPNFSTTPVTTNTGFTNMCTSWQEHATFKNSGTAAAGLEKSAGMYNLKTRIEGFNGGTISSLTMSFSSFNVNSNSIGATGSNTTMYTIDFTDQFAFDPDGPGVGLDDLDGDTYYDDLPKDATVTLSWTVNPNCDPTCGANLAQGFGYRLLYDNMCGSPIASSFKGAGHLVLENSFSLNSHVPANITGGTPFRMSLDAGAVNNTNIYAGVNTRYQYRIALVPGLSVASTPDYTYGTGTPTVSTLPGSGVGVPDTLVIQSPNNSMDTAGVNLVYTCGSGGNINIWHAIVKVQDITVPCMCTGVKFCKIASPLAHCPAPCPAGPTNYLPTVRRIDNSLGWTDATMATRQSASAISAYDLSKALYLDTIQITGSALQNNTASNLHLSLELSKTSPSNFNKLQPLNIAVQIYRGSPTKTLIHSCTLSAADDSSTSTMQKIDWNICLPGGGLLAGDSIISLSRYVVATNKELPQLDIQSGGQWYYYNQTSTSKDFCDFWIPEMYLVGTNMIVASNYTNLTGCMPSFVPGSGFAYMARRFSAAGQDYKSEFRPMAYIDSIVFTKSNGYSYNSAQLIRNPGTLASSTTISLTPDYVAGNTYGFINPGTWPYFSITKVNNYGGNFLPNVGNNCATTASETFNTNIYIRDYLYAFGGNPANIPSTYRYIMGSYSDENIAGILGGWNYTLNYATSTKPTVNAQNLTGDVIGTSVNHHWDVRISNPSTVTSPYIWLALEQGTGSGAINITSVVDLGTMTTLSPLGSYSCTGVTGYNWYKFSTAGLSSGANADFRVNFTYTSCSPDSILFKAGIDCSNYPATSPCDYPCTAAQQYLKVVPQPSEVQLSIDRHPGAGASISLCTEDSTRIVLNSAQAANLSQPYLTFYPPTGVTLVTPVQVEYPRGSGIFQDATVTPLGGGGYKIDLTSHSGIGTNGMKGTANANPSYTPLGYDRQALISVHFNTTCDIISGTTFSFNAYGKRPCGDNATNNGASVTTGGVQITGAGVAGSAGLTMSWGAATSVSCGATTTLSLTTIPTSTPTAANDTVIYTLPLGMTYVAGTLAGSGISTTPLVTGGAGLPVKVKVAINAGTPATTPINYSFDVSGFGEGCGAVNITAEYQRMGATLSCGGSPCPSPSRTIIASSTGPNITLSKPSLHISNTTVSSDLGNQWKQAGFEANSVKVHYTNNGTQVYTANSDTVEFFCNSSATVPFAKKAIGISLAIGASDSESYSVMMPMGACTASDEVVVRVRTLTDKNVERCLCNPTQYAMAGVPLPLNFTKANIRVQDCAVTLNWAINKAETMSGISIERSNDGGKYNTIAQLGNKEQQYIDVASASGTWYYRIVAQDKAGSKTYSPTLVAQTTRCVSGSVSVYPNPAHDELQIVLQGQSNDESSYVLYTLTGQKVLSGTLSQNSNNKLTIQHLPRGVYMLRISNNGESTIHKVELTK